MAFRDKSTTNFSTTTAVFTKPAAAVAGDVMLGWLATDAPFTITTPPTGWTQLGTIVTNGGDSAMAVFVRVLQAGDPSTWSFTLSGGGGGDTGVVAYSGVDNTTPVHKSAQVGDSASTTTHTTPSVTTTLDGCTIVGIFGGDPASGGMNATPGTGYTERVDFNDGLSNGLGWVYAEDQVQATHGAITASVTLSASNPTCCFIVALAPASTGGAHVTGSTTTPLTVSIGTAARRRRHGSTSTPLALAVVTNARRKAKDHVTLTLGVAVGSSARRLVKASASRALTLVVGTAARRRTHGTSSVALDVTVETVARRRAYAAASVAAVVLVTVGARRRTHGAASLALTLARAVAGRIGEGAAPAQTRRTGVRLGRDGRAGVRVNAHRSGVTLGRNGRNGVDV